MSRIHLNGNLATTGS